MEATDPAESEEALPARRPRVRWATELRLAAVLITFGIFVLPIAVYAVGMHVIGDYEGEAGLSGLLGDVWNDLASGSPLAWVLALSPYVVVQLARIGGRAWRGRRA